MIKTRFAPSPTGFLHVGGLRTALYSYLLAKQNGGNFILRIEDTDQKRSVEGGIENIVNSLDWAGIRSDEGVVIDKDGKIKEKGNNGPYIQSKRLKIYKKYADELIEKGFAYYCFCKEERLEELRKYQEINKIPTGYDGECRNISLENAKERIANGEKYVIRMKMPKEEETIFNDLVKREVHFKNQLVDDQVILKSDGFPTYHLAVVVDDHLMEITHIIRGEEWLSSTPKHIQLYKYFGWEIPKIAHLPLLLNPDKTKLSKRQGDVAVEDYIKKGYLHEAIVNFVAFLGWNPGTNQELFTLDELVKEFKIEKINKSGAIFNLEKLDWYNQQYIKRLPNEELSKFVFFNLIEFFADKENIQLPLTKEKFFILKEKYYNILVKAISLEKERVKTLIELSSSIKFVFELPNYDKNILIWKKSNEEETKKILSELINELGKISVQEWNKEKLQIKIGEWILEKNYSNGNVLWPLRVSLSGQQNSPGPFEIAEVLGKEESLNRIKLAINK